MGKAPSGTAAVFFDTGHSTKLKVATGNVTLTGDKIDLGDSDSILCTGTSGASHLTFDASTVGRAIVLGSGSDVANSLTFTTVDLAAIAQGGTNNGFGLITIGSSGGANTMSIASVLSFSTNLSLEALGGMSLVIPPGPYNQAAALLNVTGTLNLNSSPLHLTAPATAASTGTVITLFHTTGGLAESTFANLPQGTTVTDSAGHSYTISYTGNGGVRRDPDRTPSCYPAGASWSRDLVRVLAEVGEGEAMGPTAR